MSRFSGLSQSLKSLAILLLVSVWGIGQTGTSPDEGPAIGAGLSNEGNPTQRSADRNSLANLPSVRTGERIRVRLDNGYQLSGTVIGLLGDRIQLEISHEKLSMSGTITIRSQNIRSIQKLDQLSPSERKRIEEIKKQYQSGINASRSAEEETSESPGNGPDTEESTPNNSTDKKNKQKGNQSDKEEEQKQKETEEDGPPELSTEQKRLLQDFPADEWTNARYQKLKSKFAFQRNNREERFLENWEKIQEAREVKNRRGEKQLLQEFHPDDGWTPDKYRYIKEDLAALEAKGVSARTQKQRRFLEVYPRWKKAYDRYRERQKNQDDDENTEANDASDASSTNQQPDQQKRQE